MYFVEFWAELRTMEINDWLKTHPEVSRWVAVDDMPLMCKNFVQTPLPTEGIKQSGIPEKIISTLKD
jgi:hypothetical protein